MRQSKRGTEGFTLVEVLTVITIVALLASVAIPSYLNYIKKARTVEAIDSLSKIAIGAKLYFMKDRLPGQGALVPELQAASSIGANPPPVVARKYLPASSAGYVPVETHASVCSTGSGAFPKSLVTQFRAAPWYALLFAPDRDFRYRYTWILSQQSTSALKGLAYSQALGDLDCDGIYSVWRVTLREERDASGSYLRTIGPGIFQRPETE
jgi:prepilin-type N-terminal cleavage/methylation domain-containing protein